MSQSWIGLAHGTGVQNSRRTYLTIAATIIAGVESILPAFRERLLQPLIIVAELTWCPAVPKSQTFSGIAIKRPISAAVAGTGNSSVFRYTLRVPDSHTFWRNAASSGDSGSNALKSLA
jgi:hypothetical protein